MRMSLFEGPKPGWPDGSDGLGPVREGSCRWNGEGLDGKNGFRPKPGTGRSWEGPRGRSELTCAQLGAKDVEPRSRQRGAAAATQPVSGSGSKKRASTELSPQAADASRRKRFTPKDRDWDAAPGFRGQLTGPERLPDHPVEAGREQCGARLIGVKSLARWRDAP